MSLLKRLHNLWELSRVDVSEWSDPIPKPQKNISSQKAKIIISTTPEDELIETIRKENTGQA